MFETIERERMEERADIFKRMNENGVSAEQIAFMTGFRIEEVKESLK